MADLSFMHEEVPTTVDAINLLYEARRSPRSYLGLSQAGHSCHRYLWYTYRGYEQKAPEGRVLRLFQLGNILEDQVIADLRDCGFIVRDQQKEVEFTQGEHKLVGHIDGIIEGLLESPATPHLFECKTASKKKFDELLKLGSYRKWNEIYYWQVQFYMLDLHLKRAAVFVYCKDDSRLHLERIKADKDATIEKLQSIFDVLDMEGEPDRRCKRADHWEAKWCPFYNECFGNGVRRVRPPVGW